MLSSMKMQRKVKGFRTKTLILLANIGLVINGSESDVLQSCLGFSCEKSLFLGGDAGHQIGAKPVDEWS